MPTQKKILYICDYLSYEGAWIEALKEKHDLHIAEGNGFSKFAVDKAVKLLQDEGSFDLVVSGMAMAAGFCLRRQPTEGGLTTGRELIKYLRREGNETPVLLFGSAKSMYHAGNARWDSFRHDTQCEGTPRLQESEEVVPLLNKENATPEKLLQAVERLSVPLAAPDQKVEEAFSLEKS